MISAGRGADWVLRILLVVSTLLITAPIYIPAVFTSTVSAGNRVMGEIQFEGRSKIERTSGVWVDGEYVGYLKELKGSKKVLLLPGEHVITVRQNGCLLYTSVPLTWVTGMSGFRVFLEPHGVHIDKRV